MAEIVSPEQWAEFDVTAATSTSPTDLPGVARFRGNYLQAGERRRRGLPDHSRGDPHHAEQLGLSRRRSWGSAELEKGLVLVTGPTGSGKSTTLAAMVDRINDDPERATS